MGESVKSAKLLKTSKIFKMLKMMRLSKVHKIIRFANLPGSLDELMSTSQMQARITFGGLFCVMLLICHWLACGMCLFGCDFSNSNCDLPSVDRYLTGYYWAITTVTTVGYGDITGSTTQTRCYTVFAMLVGGAFYGYFIGSISSVVSINDLNAKAYFARMDNLQAWLDHSCFPPELRSKIHRYFKTHFSQKPAPDEISILTDLSPELRNAVSKYLIGGDVMHIPMFERLPKGVMPRIMQILQSTSCEADSVICEDGEAGSAMYIITKGIAHKTVQNSDETIRICTGDCFGEEIVVGCKEAYEYTIIAATDIELIYIAEDELRNCLVSMPDVFKSMRATVARRYGFEDAESEEDGNIKGQVIYRMLEDLRARWECEAQRLAAHMAELRQFNRRVLDLLHRPEQGLELSDL